VKDHCVLVQRATAQKSLGNRLYLVIWTGKHPDIGSFKMGIIVVNSTSGFAVSDEINGVF
jgi:hypothetical protein